MNNTKVENAKMEGVKLFIIFAIMVAANYLSSLAVNALYNNGIDLPIVVYGTLIEVLIMLPAIVYILAGKENLFDSLGFHKIKISTVLWTVLLTFFSLPLLYCANVLSQLFVPNALAQASGELTSGSTLASYFIMAIAAPVCEEIAMRGFQFNRFKKITSLLAAAAISAVMFGILHLNINQMCYAIVLGFVFAYANYASGSIWTSIIMHFIINSLGFAAVLFASASAEAAGQNLAEGAEALRTTGNFMLITGGVLLVISIICVFPIKKIIRKIAKNENNQEAMAVFCKKEKAAA